MAKQASIREIERWRQDYWLLRKKYSNKEIAQKLGIDPGNLSALGKGTMNKKGKPKNPGKEFIKHFYMSYPELTGSPEDQPADANPNKEPQEYQQGGLPSDIIDDPAQVYHMNWDDAVSMRNELLSSYKKNDEFFRTELSKTNTTNQTAVAAVDKAVAAVDKMAESILIQSQELAFYRKLTISGPDNSSLQS